jgi:hypothetical protein
LDEVSNQLDRLSALPSDQLADALEQVQVSDWTLTRLPGAVLTSRLEAVDMGSRLTLELSYGAEFQRPAGQTHDRGFKRKTVTLESWIPPALQKSAAAPAEEES